LILKDVLVHPKNFSLMILFYFFPAFQAVVIITQDLLNMKQDYGLGFLSKSNDNVIRQWPHTESVSSHFLVKEGREG